MPSALQLLLGGSQAAAVDPYFYSVTSLLHGDGTNGAQNNTFLDSSTNNFTITRNGNTTQGSFSPFSQTGWSNYFNGSTDYFYWTQPGSTYPNQLAFLNGASAVGTIEAWVYVNSVNAGANLYDVPPIIAVGDTYFSFSVTSTNKLRFYWYTGVANAIDTTGSVPFNTWTHVAAVRNGATVKLYINGIESGSGAYTGWSWASGSGGTLMIVGVTSPGGTSRFFNGYISNLRVINGTAQYTSNFTPSTSPLTAVTNTSLLTCQSNRFSDNSTNNITWTVIGGSPSVQPFSPFNPITAYSTSAVGGSGYFDGSGDYLTVPYNSALDFGSSDFTVEGWVYSLSNSSFYLGVVSTGWSLNAAYAPVIILNNAGTLVLYASSNGSSWDVANASTIGTIPLNTWNHFAVSRSGSSIRLFLNGVLNTTITSSATLISYASRNFAIGAGIDGTTAFNGYISNLRVVKGTAVYTAAFTPPTAPLTAIANTSLLTNFTNGGIFDNAAVADYETVGNAQINTSVKKYGTGSMAFDGSGDYLKTPVTTNLDFGTGDFTVEMWVYFNNTTDSGGLGAGLITNSAGNITIYSSTNNGTTLTFYNGSGIVSGTISLSNWIHVAVSRSAGVVKMFINGSQTGSAAHTSAVSFSGAFVGSQTASGGYLNGYIDDLRISKGVGRYTYNFTPPTAEFPNIGGPFPTLLADPYYEYTTLLLPANGTNGAQNNTFLDGSTNNFTITRNGNTTQGTFSPFSQTGWSNYFDGTGDYLSVADNAAFTLGSGDFTFECWVYWQGSGQQRICGQGDNAGNNFSFALGTTSTDKAIGRVFVGATGYSATSSANLVKNQWNHFAFVRDGNTARLYINGTQDGTVDVSGVTVSDVSSQVSIGRPGEFNSEYWNGYISNFRLVKGTCVYPSGTTFTPPTAPLTAITNTSLLTCQSNRFVDNSTNAFTITRNGDVSVQAFSPFNPTAAWSATTNGGSGYFDGSGDYLSLADNAAFAMGTGNFTAEFWLYTADQSNNYPGILSASTYTDTGAISIRYDNTGNANKIFIYLAGASPSDPAVTSSAYAFGQWIHVAVIRDSSTALKIYVNGVLDGTATISAGQNVDFSGANSFYIGRGFDVDGGAAYYAGYITNVRLVKGQALASGNFTPPTAPVTASSVGWTGANAAGSITGTVSLLMSATNAGIYDATSKNDLETVGNAQISTTQSKFGGSSIYIPAAATNVYTPASPNLDFGTGDFTVECWVYSVNSGTGLYPTFISSVTGWSAGASGHRFNNTGAASKFTFHLNGAGDPFLTSASTFSFSTWYHYALTRYGNTWRMFIDGNLQASGTYSGSFNQALGGMRLGYSQWDGVNGYYNGYIDDLRITKGIARYTSNFTPPTTAFLTL